MVTQGNPLPAVPADEVVRPIADDLTVRELRALIAQAGRAVGSNVSLGLYANGDIYSDGHDFHGSLSAAIEHLEALAGLPTSPAFVDVKLPMSTVMQWANAAGLSPEIRAACRDSLSKVA